MNYTDGVPKWVLALWAGIILLCIAFWTVVIWVIIHFARKWW